MSLAALIRGRAGRVAAEVVAVPAVVGADAARMESLADAGELTAADCVELVCAFHAENEAAYVPGALPWAFEHCSDLKRRFAETEAAIDRLVDQRPTETDFRVALAAHTACWREISGRYRAHLERQAERADPMPELPEATVLAIGVSYGDGEPGTWNVIREGRRHRCPVQGDAQKRRNRRRNAARRWPKGKVATKTGGFFPASEGAR